MEPIFYYNPACQASRTVLVFLQITNFSCQKKLVSLAKGENKTAEFTQLNPLQQVPVLQDGSFAVREAEGIIKYIIETKKIGIDYYPPNPKNRALINKYLGYHHSTFLPYLKLIMVECSMQESVKYAFVEFKRHCQDFQDHILGEKQYVAGEKFTIADIFATNQLLTVVYVTNVDLEEYPGLIAYLKRCMKNPCFAEINQPLETYYTMKNLHRNKKLSFL